MKTLVIKESKWLRAEHNCEMSGSTLLDDTGKMCCLGFLGKACGAIDEQLLWHGTPASNISIDWVPGLLSLDRTGNSILCQEIIGVNDDSKLTLEERKARLTELFEKLDIALEFVP